MKKMLVKHALACGIPQQQVCIEGWVRTRRDARTFSFLAVNDGTCQASIQVVVDEGVPGYEMLGRLGTGASVRVQGDIVESPGGGQKWELRAAAVQVIGDAAPDYPLQKKHHSSEFLRTVAHLRPRTNLYGAVFRMRSRVAAAVHRFFLERDFVWVHTPIITASDCEGAGEMFRVTTLDPLACNTDYEQDFFGKPTSLTVSGQLEGEAFACALSRIYTFGPTFRAENSNTPRHAAEFWMIEPEVAFCDLEGNMQLVEDFLRYVVDAVLQDTSGDFDFFCKYTDPTLRERLEVVRKRPFVRCSYTDAVQLMQQSGQKFEYAPRWGMDMQTEHERFLAEKHFGAPVIVYDYPRDIKAFYMRQNEDGRTVRAMDVLVAGVGELMGGSQREEREEFLREAMQRNGLKEENYAHYLDLRRYGSVPHSGFGVGFERLMMFVTGVQNIRDVLPYPRTPHNCGS